MGTDLLVERLAAKGMYLAFFLFIAFILIFTKLVRRMLPTEKEDGQPAFSLE